MEGKLKLQFKLADKFLDLKTVDTNMVIAHLEEQIKLRETPIEKRKLFSAIPPSS